MTRGNFSTWSSPKGKGRELLGGSGNEVMDAGGDRGSGIVPASRNRDGLVKRCNLIPKIHRSANGAPPLIKVKDPSSKKAVC